MTWSLRRLTLKNSFLCSAPAATTSTSPPASPPASPKATLIRGERRVSSGVLSRLHSVEQVIKEEDEEQVDAPKAAPTQTPQTTKSFDDTYQIHGELGSGHFSRVFLATRRSDGMRFAVKRIPKAKDATNEAQFREEVAIHSGLHHHAILRLQETFESATEWQLVLQLAEGGELFRLVEQGQLPEAVCLVMARNLLQALDYLHSRGVVHRDIKPENILLANRDDGVSGDILLADFGLSTVVRPGEKIMKPCGSFEYAAPEVLRKPVTGYDNRADMWSFGVLLFVLLGGYHPFQHDDEKKSFRHITSANYRFHSSRWGSVSDEAKDLVTSLLQPNPECRLSAAEALNHPWFRSSF